MSWYMIAGALITLTVAALAVYLLGIWFKRRGWFSYDEPKE